MVFYDYKFIFDGIDSTEKNIILVDTDERNVLMDFGTVYTESVTSNTTFGGVLQPIKEHELPQKFTLEFCLIENTNDGTLIPDVWTEDKERDFLNWIVKDDFCDLISYDNKDLKYVVKATKVSKKFNYAKKGVYIVEFQPFYHSPIKTIKVKGTSTSSEIVINCNTNKDIYPTLLFKNIGVDEILVKNNSIKGSLPLVLHNVNGKKLIELDNKYFLVKDDYGNNAFDKVKDRNWLKLKDGENRITMTSGLDYEILFNEEVRI